MQHIRPLIILLVALLTPAACAGSDEPSVADAPTLPPAGSQDQVDDSGGDGAAGGTALRAYPLEEALATDLDGPTLITGLLINDGSGWRLCSGVAESYPPQCAGESVTVEGVRTADHPFIEESGVQWAEEATVLGELQDGVITVTGSAASA